MPTPIQALTALEMAEGSKHTGVKVVTEIVQGDEGPVAVVPGAPGGGPAPIAVPNQPAVSPAVVTTGVAHSATAGSVPEFLRRVEADLEVAAKKLGG